MKLIETLFKKESVIIFFILLSTFFAVRPLLVPGFFPIHDDEQVGRLYDLDKTVKAGEFPPRLTQDLGFGFDYPLFNFYPPFVYYVSEVFVLLGFSYITSIKLMIALGFFLAAITMYLFSKEYLGRYGAVLAAIAYTYAPYHSVDVYVRGALPEFWSFVFVPLLFWCLYKIAKTTNPFYIVLTAVSAASFLLTHDLIAMMASLFLAVYALFLFLQTKEKLRFSTYLCASAILALGLSAYFWIPAIFEKKYTMVDLLTTELANYNLHFVYLRQLWNSPWGYGGSLYGLDDGLSFQIGQAQLILAAIATSFVCISLFKTSQKKIVEIVGLFLFLLIMSVYFLSFYSKPIWDAIQPFWYIQFPWRFLLFSAFTVSFIPGGFFVFIQKRKKLSIILLFLSITFILATNISYFAPEKYYTNATDVTYTDPSVIQWRTSNMAFEYTPRGIATKKSEVGNTVIDITPKDVPQKSYQVVSGTMQVTEKMNKTQEKQYSISVQKAGQFRVNVFNFPGWAVYVNSQKVKIFDNNTYKLVTIPVKEGTYTVRAVFEETLLRKIGDTLSLISGIIIVLFLGIFLHPKHKKIL